MYVWGGGRGGGNVCADHLCFLSRLPYSGSEKVSLRGVTGASAAIGLGVDNMSRAGGSISLKIQVQRLQGTLQMQPHLACGLNHEKQWFFQCS